jgi:amino acid permease
MKFLSLALLCALTPAFSFSPRVAPLTTTTTTSPLHLNSRFTTKHAPRYSANKPATARASTRLAPLCAAAAADKNNKASVTSQVFNLFKAIVGSGVLTLPAGIAAFGNAPSAVLPATLLIALFGFLSAYGFALIGRVCHMTETTTFRDAWSASLSSESSWVCAVTVVAKAFLSVLAYSMILSDNVYALLLSFGVQSYTKTQVLVGMTSLVLLPLCWLKNLKSLAPFSFVGSLGMIYTGLAMGIRYWGKDYTPSGRFYSQIPYQLRPSFGTIGAEGVFNPRTNILIGMLSTAYMAHFSAPRFLNDLENPTMERFFKVTSLSFGASMVLFAAMAAVGFMTFGANCSGLILNNYAVKDPLMSLSRLAVTLALVFSYPIAFAGLRDGVFDILLSSKDKEAPKRRPSKNATNLLTVLLLAAVTGGTFYIPDVSFLMALVGSTLGATLIYIFPALMFRGAVRKNKMATPAQKREVKWALLTGVVGLVTGTMGAVKAIQSVARV